MSVLRAPARPEVFVGWMGYGTLAGARSYSRARLWVLAASAEPGAALSAMIAWNDPRTGTVVYEDLGPLTSAHLTQNRGEVRLAVGSTVALAVAPCVCGAGAVGYAAPGPDRPRVTMVSLAGHPALT